MAEFVINPLDVFSYTTVSNLNRSTWDGNFKHHTHPHMNCGETANKPRGDFGFAAGTTPLTLQRDTYWQTGCCNESWAQDSGLAIKNGVFASCCIHFCMELIPLLEQTKRNKIQILNILFKLETMYSVIHSVFWCQEPLPISAMSLNIWFVHVCAMPGLWGHRLGRADAAARRHSDVFLVQEIAAIGPPSLLVFQTLSYCLSNIGLWLVWL